MPNTLPSDTPGLGLGLVDFLRLEQVAPDVFHGWCHEGLPLRAFGGQVAAQALTAAGRTVPEGRIVHSLHGYFLRGGNTARPVVYRVERLREGGSFATRQVSAEQDGDVVFTLSASFKHTEHAYDRQSRMPATPDPDTLPDLFELWAASDPEDFGQQAYRQALEIRRVPDPPEPGSPGMTEQKLWIRAAGGPLPDDPLLHACSLAYASDLFLAPTAALALERPRPLRGEPSKVYLTSLDHALWFHRPFRADEWMLFAQRSPSSVDGRALTFADVWSHDGRLIAHVVQEAVLRPLRETRR
ncbi:acyl-CoA thioesterase [Streptomyces sp. NPDC020965]|uniref:acyl-CoA thioesterase n=1 Tax=Streptomyces sp. NPDC020965 TaxID=3365105 RepID=UPI003787BB5C